MKHTCLLFVGDEFTAMAKGTRKYVLKYSQGQVQDYLSVMLLSTADEGYELSVAKPNEPDNSSFASDLDKAFQVSLVKGKLLSSANFIKEAGSFLSDFFSEQVTLKTQGDGRLSLCIIISPFENPESPKLVENICQSICDNKLRYDVDVIVYPNTGQVTYDTSLKSEPAALERMRKNTKEVVDNLLELRGKNHCMRLVTLIQNKNQRGVTITFSMPNLIRILGEYAIAVIENFNAIFPPAILLDNNNKLCTIGVSQLSFDRNYMVQYLLHQAFIHMLEQEKVDHRDIDINKVAAVAKEYMMKHHQPLNVFYKRYITPILGKGGTQQEAINTCGTNMNNFFEEMEKDLLGFMDSKNLSLPEKRCVIALILGEDDPLMSGALFDKDQITFLDYYSEAVNLFTSYNNSNIHQQVDSQGMHVKDKYGNPIFRGGVITKSVDNMGVARFRIDELKRMRVAIRQSISYIRQKEEELDALVVSQKREEQSYQVVSTDGMVFGGHTYKFIPDEPPVPTNETYQPKSVKADNINLSEFFSPVRDQGDVGSCTPHALVAIYEYILKKNDKKDDSDLSERYVYYNVRKNNDKTDIDEGSTIYDAIRSLEKDGVCLETLCPYDTNQSNTEPSAEAYEDGRKRKVLKTMIIPIGDDTQNNIDSMRSALNEGYPIAFGLRLFDSFSTSNGFVTLPTEEEIAGTEKRFHAMVICGYDDEQKYFLVRNSWGSKFGKDGYCYIPYAYIGDRRLISSAYIITEISQDGVNVAGVVGKERFSFNAADNDIKAAVIRNLVIEERNKLHRLSEEYKRLRYSTEELLQQLSKVNTRDNILKETKLRLQANLSGAKSEKDNLTNIRVGQLQMHERETAKGYIWLAVLALIFLLIDVVSSYHWWSDTPLNIGKHTFLFTSLFGICLLLIGGWYIHRRYGYKHLREDLNNLIQSKGKIIGEKEREIESLKLKFHVAGMMMERLANLDRKLNHFYQSSRNYVSNLSQWYKDERIEREKMSPLLTPPFDTIIDTKTLDAYFSSQKESILKDHNLYSLLCDGTYQLGTNKIISFQRKLQKHILDCLNQEVEKFSMLDYVTGNRQYPFLPATDSKEVKEKLALLNLYSLPFTQLINTVTPSIYILIHHDGITGDNGPWLTVLTERPSVLNTTNPNALTLIKTAFVMPEEVTMLT